MTRKIALFFLVFNISFLSAQESCCEQDIKMFQETIQDNNEVIEKAKQTILRLYLAGRRTINPFVVNHVLARTGIKNESAKIGAHAIFNTASHIAVYKALDPKIELEKLIKGALIFSSAEAIKSKSNELIAHFMPRSMTSDSFYYTAYERFFVIARCIWNCSDARKQRIRELLEADSLIVTRPGLNSAYSAQIRLLHNGNFANMITIIDALGRKLKKHPEDKSLAKALDAAKNLLQYQQGILHNIKDMALTYAKEEIEKKVDEQVDWTIEYIQK